MMSGMKMSFNNGRIASTPGPLPDLPQYLVMAVEPLVVPHLVVFVKMIHLSITVLGMTPGPMGLAVGHPTKRYSMS